MHFSNSFGLKTINSSHNLFFKDVRSLWYQYESNPTKSPFMDFNILNYICIWVLLIKFTDTFSIINRINSFLFSWRTEPSGQKLPLLNKKHRHRTPYRCKFDVTTLLIWERLAQMGTTRGRHEWLEKENTLHFLRLAHLLLSLFLVWFTVELRSNDTSWKQKNIGCAMWLCIPMFPLHFWDVLNISNKWHRQ